MSSHLRRRALYLARDFRVPPHETDGAVHNLLSAIDCPRSLTVWLLFKHKEHNQLVDLECSPQHYSNAEEFRNAYVATEFLSKANFLELATDRKAVAMKKFFDFEELCARTNSYFRFGGQKRINNPLCERLLFATIRKVHQILGEFSGEEWIESCNWGPGVSTLIKGDHVSATNKFQSEIGITRDLHSLVSEFLSQAYPLWALHLARISEVQVQMEDTGVTYTTSMNIDPSEKLVSGEAFKFEVGNHVVTVPKNAKTDRVIAIEPGLNIWFQLGVGSMIRRRLRRYGIDLNSQEHNQRLAKLGSLTGHLATVDFSSASDSIAKELVRVLLPQTWFQVMDSCRSHFGVIDGKPRLWNKFSSMGNGFTFELESLIFYAAALAVCEYRGVSSKQVSVYGDDVIIPTETIDTFSEFSAFLGFKLNPRKTFASGLFRESCGEHYFSGVSCKPVYLKERLRNVSSIYRLANGIRLLANRCLSDFGCDRRFYQPWVRLVSRVPKPLRFWVSRELGDTGFISNFDEASPSKARHGIEGYYTFVLSEMGLEASSDQLGHLLAKLGRQRTQGELSHLRHRTRAELDLRLINSTVESGNYYTLRNRTKLKISRVLVPQWCNLGGWI